MKTNQTSFKSIYRVKANHTSRRSYSTFNSSKIDIPVPVLTLTDLQNKDNIFYNREILLRKGGIYSFINKINGKQYIDSAKDLYLRLREHLSNRKSNKALQITMDKYGLENFNYCIYEYFTYDNKTTSSKLLTDLETMYINKFEFSNL
jgi:hypothetical protein